MSVSLTAIARALGGKVSGGQVHAPGPGHSRRDRSLSIKRSAASPDGFIVYSHAGDDWRVCRDYVADAIGLPADRWRSHTSPIETQEHREAQSRADERHRAAEAARASRALAMWSDGIDPRGTVVETYLRSRSLDLPDEVAGDILRFHPRCPWHTSTTPAMVAPLCCISTGEIVGVHRTALSPDARKLGRRMFGTASGTAIMLDPDEAVTLGLHIGEGIETCLAARQLGLRPTWALGSTSGIAAFPILSGIEALTILCETEDGGASERAANEVGTRWHRAGRTVELIHPKVSGDLNDAIRMEASDAA